MANPDRILHNVVLFCRTLRQKGLAVTTGQILVAVDAARYVSLAKREDVKAALRAILVNRKEDLDTFNESFDAFWSSSRGKTELELGRLLQRTTRIHQSALLDQALADSDSSRTEEGPEPPMPRRQRLSRPPNRQSTATSPLLWRQSTASPGAKI